MFDIVVKLNIKRFQLLKQLPNEKILEGLQGLEGSWFRNDYVIH